MCPGFSHFSLIESGTFVVCVNFVQVWFVDEMHFEVFDSLCFTSLCLGPAETAVTKIRLVNVSLMVRCVLK